jgi:putative ABC transport system permease protein
VWLITFRDLQWRRRRFAFGVVGTALVFAVTLLLAGLSASLRAEARRTVAAVGADTWIVGSGVTGPFSGISALPELALAATEGAAGVTRADPLIVTPQSLQRSAPDGKPRGEPKDVTLFGYRTGGLGEPPLRAGRGAAAPGEAVVDRSSGVRLGQPFLLAGRPFTVVGESRGLTLRGGLPSVFVAITDAQRLVFGGQPLATAVVTKGTPPATPGLSAMSADEARADVLRPFGQALQAIDVLQVLLWLVAVAIVGTLIYLSVLERIGDFAILKAIGTDSRALFVSLTIQAVLVSVLSAMVAIVIAHLMAPSFPLPISLRAQSGAILPVVAVGVGVLASLVGLRRAVSVDPALAFGSA